MKKRIVWLAVAVAAFGLYAPAETVITSPTGLPDESDAVLESAVKAVKDIPSDTVKAVGGAVVFTGDELRNTAHGIKAAFQGDTPREVVRQDMLGKVTGAWNDSGAILMRTYAVSPAVGEELAPGAKDATTDVRNFFTGIEFPEGATAYYRPGSHRLVVFNTAANLDAVEEVIARHHRAEREYKQVQINAKFIEVSQSKLDQLGFSWSIQDEANGVNMPGGWTVNGNQDVFGGALRTASSAFGSSATAGSMVMTKTGWMPLKVAINALEQAGDSDVLSSPSLTTLDGKAADIWVGEDRAVPHSFSVKNADVNIHIQHEGWKSELMGVSFNVKPEIQKDGMIRLSLNPKVVDLIGYDTYQVSPEGNLLAIQGLVPTVSGTFPILKYNLDGTLTTTWQKIWSTIGGLDPNVWWGSSITATTPVYRDSARRMQHDDMGFPLLAIDGQLPYFRVREIKTQVDVADGSTVGLGGLVYDRLETYKDKIPVLGSIPLVGRLFRSEGERSIKRNLMIFVSASRMGNDGQLKSDVAINN